MYKCSSPENSLKRECCLWNLSWNYYSNCINIKIVCINHKHKDFGLFLFTWNQCWLLKESAWPINSWTCNGVAMRQKKRMNCGWQRVRKKDCWDKKKSRSQISFRNLIFHLCSAWLICNSRVIAASGRKQIGMDNVSELWAISTIHDYKLSMYFLNFKYAIFYFYNLCLENSSSEPCWGKSREIGRQSTIQVKDWLRNYWIRSRLGKDSAAFSCSHFLLLKIANFVI